MTTNHLIPHDLAPARIRAFTTLRAWMHHGLTEEEWRNNREWATGTDYVPCRFFADPTQKRDGAFVAPSPVYRGGGVWDGQSGPVRANAPQAGAAGYEMGNEPRGTDWWEIVGTIIGVIIILLLGAALIWACWWAACRALERGPWWT